MSGIETFYLISNWGRVYSTKSKIHLKPRLCRKGYGRVVINKIDYSVHRLVASHFLSNPDNKPQVNHINGIKNDNRVVNLEWVTNSENLHHSFDHLDRNQVKGEQVHLSKLTEENVLEIFKSNISSSKLAKKYLVNKSTILSIKNGKTWNHVTKLPKRKNKKNT